MKLIDAPTAPWGNAKDWLTVDGDPHVRIERSASVSDSASVCDYAIVYGSASVYGYARVCDSARVYDSACVCGDGDIAHTNDYMTISPIGRKISTLTLHRDRKLGVRINRGCFSGSMNQFMARLEDNPAHDFYRQIVPLMHDELVRRMTPLDIPAQKEHNDER